LLSYSSVSSCVFWASLSVSDDASLVKTLYVTSVATTVATADASNIKAAQRQANSQLGEATIALKLAGNLEELGKKTNKTAEDKRQMANIVDQLNTKIPNLALSINTETGELNKQINTVYDAITAYKQLMLVKAGEKKASVAAESLIDFGDQKALLEAQIKPLQKIVDKYNAYNSKKTKVTDGSAITIAGSADEASTNEKYNKIIDKYNSLKEQIGIINGQINDANKQIENSFKLSEEYSKKYGAKKDDGTVKPPEIDNSFSTYKKQYEAGLITAKEYKQKLQNILADTKPNTDDYYNIQKAIKSVNKTIASETKKTTSDIAKENKDAAGLAVDNIKLLLEKGEITEAEYYKRYEAIRDKYFKTGTSDWYDYTTVIQQYQDKIFNDRRTASDQWIENQKSNGKITSSQEIAAYERIRKYVTQYYKQNVIDSKEYQKQITEINKSEYDVRKTAIEKAINDEAAAEKKALDTKKDALEKEKTAIQDSYEARKKAIDDYYDEIEAQENRQDRSDKLADLQQEEAKYANAATKEGRDKLKQIQDEIKDVNKEIAKDLRDTEKKKKLDEAEQERDQLEAERLKKLDSLNEDYNNLDSAQKSLLDNISKYASISAGAIETATKKIQEMVQELSKVKMPSVTGTQTSGNSSTGGAKVNFYNYGPNYLNGVDDIQDFGNEIIALGDGNSRGGA
jgi:chromosome segregation ATPase